MWSAAIVICVLLSLYVLLFASFSQGGTADTQATDTQTEQLAADDTGTETTTDTATTDTAAE